MRILLHMRLFTLLSLALLVISDDKVEVSDPACPSCWQSCGNVRQHYIMRDVDKLSVMCPEVTAKITAAHNSDQPVMDDDIALMFNLRRRVSLTSNDFMHIYSHEHCSNIDCEEILFNGFISMYYDSERRFCLTKVKIPNCITTRNYFHNDVAVVSVKAALHGYEMNYVGDQQVYSMPVGMCSIFVSRKKPYTITFINDESDRMLAVKYRLNDETKYLTLLPKDSKVIVLPFARSTTVDVRCGEEAISTTIEMSNKEVCKSNYGETITDTVLSYLYCVLFPSVTMTIYSLVAFVLVITLLYLCPIIVQLAFYPVYLLLDYIQMKMPKRWICTACGGWSLLSRFHDHEICVCGAILKGEASVNHRKVCDFYITHHDVRMRKWINSRAGVKTMVVITCIILLIELAPTVSGIDVACVENCVTGISTCPDVDTLHNVLCPDGNIYPRAMGCRICVMSADAFELRYIHDDDFGYAATANKTIENHYDVTEDKRIIVFIISLTMIIIFFAPVIHRTDYFIIIMLFLILSNGILLMIFLLKWSTSLNYGTVVCVYIYLLLSSFYVNFLSGAKISLLSRLSINSAYPFASMRVNDRRTITNYTVDLLSGLIRSAVQYVPDSGEYASSIDPVTTFISNQMDYELHDILRVFDWYLKLPFGKFILASKLGVPLEHIKNYMYCRNLQSIRMAPDVYNDFINRYAALLNLANPERPQSHVEFVVDDGTTDRELPAIPESKDEYEDIDDLSKNLIVKGRRPSLIKRKTRWDERMKSSKVKESSSRQISEHVSVSNPPKYFVHDLNTGSVAAHRGTSDGFIFKTADDFVRNEGVSRQTRLNTQHHALNSTIDSVVFSLPTNVHSHCSSLKEYSGLEVKEPISLNDTPVIIKTIKNEELNKKRAKMTSKNDMPSVNSEIDLNDADGEITFNIASDANFFCRSVETKLQYDSLLSPLMLARRLTAENPIWSWVKVKLPKVVQSRWLKCTRYRDLKQYEQPYIEQVDDYISSYPPCGAASRPATGLPALSMFVRFLAVCLVIPLMVKTVNGSELYDAIEKMFSEHIIELKNKGFVASQVDFTACTKIANVISRDNDYHAIQMSIRPGACIRYEIAGSKVELGVYIRKMGLVATRDFSYKTCDLLHHNVYTYATCPGKDAKYCLGSITKKFPQVRHYPYISTSRHTHVMGCGIGSATLCGYCKPDVTTNCMDVYKATNVQPYLDICVNLVSETVCSLLVGLTAVESKALKVLFDPMIKRDDFYVAVDSMGVVHTGSIAKPQSDESTFGQPQFKSNGQLLHYIKAPNAYLHFGWLWNDPTWEGGCMYSGWHLKHTLQRESDMQVVADQIYLPIETLGTTVISVKVPEGFREIISEDFRANIKIQSCAGCFRCSMYTICKISVASDRTSFAKMACQYNTESVVKVKLGTNMLEFKVISHEKNVVMQCFLKTISGKIVANDTIRYEAAEDLRDIIVSKDTTLHASISANDCGDAFCSITRAVRAFNPLNILKTVVGVVFGIIGIIGLAFLIRFILKIVKEVRSTAVFIGDAIDPTGLSKKDKIKQTMKNVGRAVKQVAKSDMRKFKDTVKRSRSRTPSDSAPEDDSYVSNHVSRADDPVRGALRRMTNILRRSPSIGNLPTRVSN